MTAFHPKGGGRHSLFKESWKKSKLKGLDKQEKRSAQTQKIWMEQMKKDEINENV